MSDKTIITNGTQSVTDLSNEQENKQEKGVVKNVSQSKTKTAKKAQKGNANQKTETATKSNIKDRADESAQPTTDNVLNSENSDSADTQADTTNAHNEEQHDTTDNANTSDTSNDKSNDKSKKSIFNFGLKNRVSVSSYLDAILQSKKAKKLEEIKNRHIKNLEKNDVLKKVLVIVTKKENIAISLSVIAIATSLYTLNQASLSRARVFLDKQNALSEIAVNFANPYEEQLKEKHKDHKLDPNLKPNATAGEDGLSETEIAYLNKLSGAKTVTDTTEDQGLTFKDEDAFRLAVEKAIFQLRQKENQLLMESKFKEFENAQNSVPNDRRIYGNPNARFIIKEFSDLECGYCKEFFAVPKEVSDVSNSQVAVEWIHTPLSFHDPVATQEAIAAECVLEQKGNKAFWVALQHIFDTTAGNGNGSSQLKDLPDMFNLDKTMFNICLTDEKIAARIDKFKSAATASGVTGTPAILIEDTLSGQTRFLGGAQPTGAIMMAIEEMNQQSARQSVVEQSE